MSQYFLRWQTTCLWGSFKMQYTKCLCSSWYVKHVLSEEEDTNFRRYLYLACHILVKRKTVSKDVEIFGTWATAVKQDILVDAPLFFLT